MLGEFRIPRSGRSKVGPSDVFSGDALLILSLCIAFHIGNSNEQGPKLKPIGSQKVIAKMLGGRPKQWDQARVSLAMKELMATVKGFPGKTGMTLYRKLCQTVRIAEELDRLELLSIGPALKRQGVAECMEQFSSSGRDQYR